ncbi:transposase [Streptomyces rishiriensis]|uniref:transposase n=1 Tax=Streptomyces rishiriensis TaxID=68264 RepID=UPI0037D9126A
MPAVGLRRGGVAVLARQYTGNAGKVTRCQVGVSLHLARDHASAAVHWRLFMPASWDPASAEADADKVARRPLRRDRESHRLLTGQRAARRWPARLDLVLLHNPERAHPDRPGPASCDAGGARRSRFFAAAHPRVGGEDEALNFALAELGGTGLHPSTCTPVHLRMSAPAGQRLVGTRPQSYAVMTA